jgi:siroheme synthase (precorrin-2 oxidase/ferrochelatase)
MQTRTHYLPIESATEGMVLAESVKDSFQRLLLPGGSTLTAENLQQLQAHTVEFICVSYEDQRSPEEIAVHSAETARSVMNIFSSADLSQPVMAALFNQILMYRSA